MTSRQLDCVFKNALETANSETAYSCSIRKIEKPSLYVAAIVARSMFISLVDRTQCGMQSLMTSNVKLEKNNAPTFRRT